MSLFGRNLTQSNGPRDVGCTIFILCATIDEHQSARFYRSIGCRRGLVMHNGTVCFVAYNAIKRNTAKQRLFCSQGGKAFV